MYWMQQTIRFEDNLALEAAIMLSKRVCLPLIVVVSRTTCHSTSSLPLYYHLLYTTLLYSIQLKCIPLYYDFFSPTSDGSSHM